jgi:uncharacterized protein (UPF0332 family)
LTYCDDLIRTAFKLLSHTEERLPSGSDCNRAVSTAYYAVFDCLCTLIANRLAGEERQASPSSELWIEFYRSVDHIALRDALLRQSDLMILTGDLFSEIVSLGSAFNKLQQARHDADYNQGRLFEPAEASQLVYEASRAIKFAIRTFEQKPLRLGYLLQSVFSMKSKNRNQK